MHRVLSPDLWLEVSAVAPTRPDPLKYELLRALPDKHPDDALGLKSAAPKKARVPDQAAQEFAERLVKFFALCYEEFGLTPAEGVYAMELAALNILNARDCPLTPAEIDQHRARAFAYFKRSLKSVPEPPKPARGARK